MATGGSWLANFAESHITVSGFRRHRRIRRILACNHRRQLSTATANVISLATYVDFCAFEQYGDSCNDRTVCFGNFAARHYSVINRPHILTREERFGNRFLPRSGQPGGYVSLSQANIMSKAGRIRYGAEAPDFPVAGSMPNDRLRD